MLTRHRTFCLAVTAICLGYASIGVMASPNTRVAVLGSPHSLIKLAQLSSGSVPEFAHLRILGNNLESAFVVLSNESDQPILAISAHWTIVGQDGKEHGSRLRCESIFTSGKPVLLSHSNILLGPSTCATAAGASSVGRIAASERNNLQVVIDAVEVRIQVDGILFGNGDMFGGDGPFYAAELKERAIAAGEVALYVRAALGEGNGRPQACLLASQHAHAARAASVGSKGGWHESFFGPLTMLADKDEKAFDLYLDRLSTVKLPVPIVVRDRE